MADPGGDQNDIVLLQPVSVCADQIFRAAAAAAVQQFVKMVGMEFERRMGIADIPVGIHKGRFHFQFLIERTDLPPHFPEKISLLCRGHGLSGLGQLLRQLSQIG